MWHPQYKVFLFESVLSGKYLSGIQSKIWLPTTNSLRHSLQIHGSPSMSHHIGGVYCFHPQFFLSLVGTETQLWMHTLLGSLCRYWFSFDQRPWPMMTQYLGSNGFVVFCSRLVGLTSEPLDYHRRMWAHPFLSVFFSAVPQWTDSVWYGGKSTNHAWCQLLFLPGQEHISL